MHAKAPGSVKWEDGEIEEINLIQACIILGQPDYVVERMSARRVALVLEISKANDEIKAWYMSKARKRG